MTNSAFARWMAARIYMKELHAARALGHSESDALDMALEVHEDTIDIAMAPDRPAVLPRFRPIQATEG